MRNFEKERLPGSAVSFMGTYNSKLFAREIDEGTVLILRPFIEVEYFKDGALLLNLRTKQVLEVGTDEGWIIRHVDGQRTVAQVAAGYAAAFSLPGIEASEKVLNTLKTLLGFQAIENAKGFQKGETMDKTRYIQNPDVNLREEDEDGALLFNPDTDRIQLLSRTGLYIWKLCVKERTVEEIAAAFKADFDEVPESEVTGDVEDFLKQMVDSGFIGILDEPSQKED